MMKISKSVSRSVSRAIALQLALGVVAGATAFAGTKLHFKTGDVDGQTDPQAFVATKKAGKKNEAAYFVVQFKGAIRAEDRQNLQTLGASIVRYVPDDALVVKATTQIAATIVRSSASVSSVMPFRSEWKIASDFSALSVFSRGNREKVLVQLFPGEKGADVAREILKLNGIRLISGSNRALVIEVAREQVEKVAAVQGVEWVQPAPQIKTMDVKDLLDNTNADDPAGDYSKLTGFESGFHLLNVEAAYARGLTGKGQIVSMADTGLDIGDIATIHPDFRGRIPSGYAFGLFSKSWEDPMGHGTHVAGSVTGSGAASGGKVRGGAFEAQFVPEGMWSPMLENLSVPPKLADLFSKAYADGARIHTNSWGSPRDLGSYDGMAVQVDEYTAANPEMLILFAAGNSGVDADKDGRVDPTSIGSPATAKNCLTVGASKNLIAQGGIQVKLSQTRLKDSWPVEPLASSSMSENAQGLAAFSSRGPTKDGRLKPEIVAPGTNILSNRSQNPKAEKLWGIYNKDYVWSGGTSMATPVTAGAAALVRQYLVDQRNIQQPSAAILKAVLMHTAFDLYPGQFGELGRDKGQELITHRPNNDEGYGRVDLDKATDLGNAILVDEKKGLGAGEMHSYPVRVAAPGKLTATLVYTDAAGSATAATALVNDLDLVLVDPKGVETSLNDHLNNAEMLQVNVDAGNYEIRVKGTNVPQGPASGKQPYGLIMSVN
jgi:serine protease AprX